MNLDVDTQKRYQNRFQQEENDITMCMRGLMEKGRNQI